MQGVYGIVEQNSELVRAKESSAHTLLLAFRGVYRGSSRNATVAATVYHIWNIRNRKLFDNVDADLDSVVRKIQIVIHTLHRWGFSDV